MPWVARLRSSRFPIVALASLLVLLIAGVAIAVPVSYTHLTLPTKA